ncbi:hypothetical protein NDU88_003391 [Pleurodeles waltl]|uniref:Uncharacterized protein n=1 Tax=Pleurodeles waltl TaxID=8319 RepID=A0AAV7QFB2_PLEWA|nr:hypothetical protein NDU88_003391 [Pleurodeles waltl]
MLLVPGGEAAAQHVRSVFFIAPNSRAIDLYVVSLTWCLVKEQQLSLLFMCSIHGVPGGGAAAQHVPALRQTGDLWHSPAHDAAVVRACRVQAWERKKTLLSARGVDGGRASTSSSAHAPLLSRSKGPQTSKHRGREHAGESIQQGCPQCCDAAFARRVGRYTPADVTAMRTHHVMMEGGDIHPH